MTTTPSEPTPDQPVDEKPTTKPSKFGFLRRPQSRTEWDFVIAAPIIIIVALFVLPNTRYAILGSVIKRAVTVDIVDSKTHKPVTDTQVVLGSSKAKTDSRGEAKFAHVPVGNWTINADKKYYSPLSATVNVPVFGAAKTRQLAITAIGNQVTVKLINAITRKPVAKATINALGTTATTNSSGEAVIVLPTQHASEPGTVKLAGYNDHAVTITNTETLTAANTFTITPNGKLYFLSKRTGVINVMKSNLDGTDTSVVVTGTGKESDTDTVLLASRDWHYLALKATRDSLQPKLYLINTATDKLTLIDQGNAGFDLIGWYDHYFTYQINRLGVQNWQPNAQSIKSYNADKDNLATLASTSATGSSINDARYEQFNDTVFMGDKLVFTRDWFRAPIAPAFNGNQNTLSAIRPDGSGSSTLKAVDAGSLFIGSVRLAKPNQLYFGTFDNGDNTHTYYSLDGSGTIVTSDILPGATDATEAISYLLSPNEKQTFWFEPRDGKNTLFIGDQNAGGAKQVASLSDFKPYGWYSDNYVLVSKDSSELYIAPADFSSPPVKVTDYHKPDFTSNGYGGGYGGGN